MTQPLNYTPKAIADILAQPCPDAPASRVGMRYIADKLREAQVFVLQDSGQLLDRTKPRPEVPGVIFKPAFPVVALEYQALDVDWGNSVYTQSRASKRIALAWDYSDDLPQAITGPFRPALPPGVVVASICWFDEIQTWLPISAAAHFSYDADWSVPPDSDFRQEMIDRGRLPKAWRNARQPESTPILLLPELFAAMAAKVGGFEAMLTAVAADLMDEGNAYMDLCYALACKNVSTREQAAPKFLNRQRIKTGKLPLKGFHVLELSGGGDMPGALGVGAERSAARSHLRRGHIRRLGAERVTWVNSTVVRGRGFVDKVYAA